VGARLVLDHLDHAAAHPGHPQRRQRDDGAQKRVRGMNLEASEPDRDIRGSFKTPKHVTRIVHVVCRQARLGERGLDAVALPSRKRGGKQPAHGGHLGNLFRAR
jgi:hypothetical protein